MTTKKDIRVRVIHEASGRFAARCDEHPTLVGYGPTPESAKEALVKQIAAK